MDKLFEIMFRFTEKDYSVMYRLFSMVPGTIVFLIISPFFLFFPSRYLGTLIPFGLSRPMEYSVMLIAGCVSLLLMFWSLYVLWFDGKGTPAPIAPTKKLVTTGPYRFVRNPIELGTDIYFLVLGTWFDSLSTGLFCMVFGMSLGLGYIKLIEEKELKLRFGLEYQQYKEKTSCMIPKLL